MERSSLPQPYLKPTTVRLKNTVSLQIRHALQMVDFISGMNSSSLATPMDPLTRVFVPLDGISLPSRSGRISSTSMLQAMVLPEGFLKIRIWPMASGLYSKASITSTIHGHSHQATASPLPCSGPQLPADPIVPSQEELTTTIIAYLSIPPQKRMLFRLGV